jgi:hypothetical protein
VIKLVAKSANCYIVAPNTAESDPISIARARQYGGMPAGAEVELQVLWDDNGVINGTPTLTGSLFRVTTTNNHGNAVIAVRDKATNDIYWSWHIWVTDYDPSIPENTWTNTNNTEAVFTFMDRNLGADDSSNATLERAFASWGLFYQWGRKDPFPGGQPGTAGYDALDEFEGLGNVVMMPSSLSLNEGLTESIRHPTTFFRDNNNSYYWMPVRYDYGWSGADFKKGVYDPCPYGWRVPFLRNVTNLNQSGPFAKFNHAAAGADSRNQSGINWTNSLGFRTFLIDAGEIYENGNWVRADWYVDYWIATAYDFESSWKYHNYVNGNGYWATNISDKRSRALVIRCMNDN